MRTKNYAKEEAEANKRRKALEEQVREAAAESKKKLMAFNSSGWKRLGAALEKTGRDPMWLAEIMCLDPAEMEGWVPLLEGKESPNPEVWLEDHPLEGLKIGELLALAHDLECSLDYLLGRTVDLLDPAWQTGMPFTTGMYYCQVKCEGHRLPMTLRWSNGLLAWQMRGGGALSRDCEVIGWWPLPPEDGYEEDTDHGED